jgi:LmbE family N-acetylglucosaminyl deacetylase
MIGRLLVIAPHPDDELLAAGGIMARHQQHGGTIAVIVATDGSRSDPAVDPSTLAIRRRSECAEGLTELLGHCPPLLFLDAPDGALDAARIDCGAGSGLAGFLGAHPPATIIVTDPADDHPDHKAAFGLAVRLVAAGYGDGLYAAPVGQRLDGAFERTGFSSMPTGWHAPTKAAAIACHASQLGSQTGFALPTDTLEPIIATEYLRLVYDRDDDQCGAVDGDHFDALFRASPDPWSYDTSPYEHDRFRRTIAALAGRRYGWALELGCANGALTKQLAPLCDALLAVDTAAVALDHARAWLAGVAHVHFAHARLPDYLPDGPFDLIVASDMLYYLGLKGVIALAPGLDAVTQPGARLLIASYLGKTETRLTGEMASEALIALMDNWQRTHAERTAQLRIDVLERVA